MTYAVVYCAGLKSLIGSTSNAALDVVTDAVGCAQNIFSLALER